MSAKQAHKGLYRNWVSALGAGLAVAGVLLIIAAVLFEISQKRSSPYLGIFTYTVFPGFIVGGLVTLLVGMRIEGLRRVRTGALEALPYPSLDLNNPVHRKRFAIGAAIGTLVLIVLAFSGYNAFLLTESVAFCGTTCHTPMQPEHTAYLTSPHARVRCVDCHVGEGAGWYVKSKINGAHQLFGVLFNSYQRPIPTPLEGLRPARETCEECHWPEKFWGSHLYQRAHFRYDEKSTPEQITLLIKTGGVGDTAAGIHWHVFRENEVEYVANDEKLQDIPWVRVKRSDGSVTEYATTEKPVPPETIAQMRHHVMDCMDCHNRPAHRFDPPDIAVDRSLASNQISQTLPYVKSVLVDALSRDYPTNDAAHKGLSREIKAFYAEKYPDAAVQRAVDIDKAVEGALAIYDRNVFPEMKVSWATYPTNIGHRNWPGCFRCHDGKHQSADGKKIISECKACHTDPKRGPQSGMGEAMAASEKNWHPWEMPPKHLEIQKHSQIQCYECHLAGRRPKTECKECHH